ncbi:symporter small accessory protein [Syntrophorhabdus aromaticivorans]|uniref:Uncharacterized protein n=1 Tax=Syntrophorhabdus aromaticivorans TaxID=328301 RepID=A0A971S0K7_9BACT|nr:symporter small accessory protein [Syntrophorhabdus aromaticivorans]NLW35191.1 hypothetical protein [Syntrophorhabdus aromaticivorans]
MLGFSDLWVFVGYVLTVCCTVFCLIYGIANRHKGITEKDGDYREEIRWEKEEIELIEKLP